MDSKLDVTSLRARRRQIEASLTRFSSFISDSVNSLNITEIQTRLEKIQFQFQEYDIVQSNLEILDEGELDKREDIENSFYKNISKARNLVADGKASQVAGQVSVQGAPNNLARLQPIELPTFSGSYEKWTNFYDTFKSLVHSNHSLDAVQKFHYLKSCLRGEAAQVIDSLEVTTANYSNAWSLLRERFENTRLIIQGHVKALFEITPLNKESVTALRAVVDNTLKHTRALQSLGEPTDRWDTILIYLISSKIDNLTKREWESSIKGNTMPTLVQFINFLKDRCLLLEAIEVNKQSKPSVGQSGSQKVSHSFPALRDGSQNQDNFHNNNSRSQGYRGVGHFNNVSSGGQGNDSPKGQGNNNARGQNSGFPRSQGGHSFSCYFCNKNHVIYRCPEFLELSVEQKIFEVKKRKLCLNCLQSGHFKNDCTHSYCRICNVNHNTLLHVGAKNNTIQAQTNPKEEQQSLVSSQISAHSVYTNKMVLLSTASIYIYDRFNQPHKCRALLDSGSQSNFISRDLVGRLQLSESNINISVTGIGQGQTGISKITSTTIKSRQNEFKTKLTFLILSTITENIPSQSFSLNNVSLPSNITLADLEFNKSGPIDVLIGAQIFYELLLQGQVSLGQGMPVLQNTKFGWVLSGPLNIYSKNKVHRESCHFSLNKQLLRFWELEEIPNKCHFSLDEQFCENFFKDTTFRDKDGRFVVRLPYNDSINNLGDSKVTALKRFEAVERRFERSDEFKRSYTDFIEEYVNMEHMSTVSSEVNDEKLGFYLPHHAVQKESSTTTKLRVVFDGSAASSSGVSLNDCLRVGPTIQDDIFDIVLRFRCYPFVMTADIAKMYRMVLVHPDDRKMQKIFWRANKDEPIQEYTLNTVTYGTSTAPFLAIRCLHEVAHQNMSQFPTACKTILKDFYVDDLMTGAESIDKAIQLKIEISSILKSCGFELRKWSSNNLEILQEVNSKFPTKSVTIEKNDKELKTLGLLWSSNNDSLQYSISVVCHDKYTKRQVLSVIAQIFDPLGLIGPAVIKAKILMQKLWQCKLSWEDVIPQELVSGWQVFLDQLYSLNSIIIPRFILLSPSDSIEIHGYCDSSEVAYGCCIYVRCLNSEKISVNLLCAKSRVAPLKKVTLPRLELCGALLLSKLYDKVKNALPLKIDKVFLWTDSTIVLSWISTQPCYLKTFVANRVAEITELTKIEDWQYVNTVNNPADIISRGINPDMLQTSQLWWHGPEFLQNTSDKWPVNSISFESKLVIPDMKQKTLTFAVFNHDFSIFSKYSSLTKLQRVVAYMLRFKSNCLSKHNNREKQVHNLTVNEMDNSIKCLLKLAQLQVFSDELVALNNHKPLKSSSKLLNLNPFLKDGLIRVGGRINNSECSDDQKNPIILPQKHILTELIILNFHHENLHAGTQCLLAIIRMQYWPISGKNAIKRVLRSCVRCFRVNPVPLTQLMGDLPSARFTTLRPFYKCGVDYAGPFMIRDGILRKSKIIKAYMCIFVCFSTKAVHIELVPDLSTEAFLNAFKRFISRRGKPSDIYSDNGTNFQGASNELRELYTLLNSQLHCDKLSNFLSKDRISWHFIPARSPHMGGLWEAAVKSAKYHLKRVISNCCFTFEQMYTILVQIEACLNSRPLTPISDDPNDFSCLTPGHFLIGDSMSAIPQPNLIQVKESRLNHYQRIQQSLQHFWNRWSREYLSQLQVRNKWKRLQEETLQPGTLVVVKDDNLPPMKWSIGRITETHAGTDKSVRVVSIRIPTGTVIKRSVTKICVLPIKN